MKFSLQQLGQFSYQRKV